MIALICFISGGMLQAADYALKKGIIIADTKFEFGKDKEGNVILIDEVLTPGTCLFSFHKNLG